MPVALERAQAKVGAKIDDPHPAFAQHAYSGGRRRVRVGDDRGVDAGEFARVELLDLKWHAVAGIEVLQRTADLRAPGDGDEVEAGMAPEQVGGESSRESCCAGDGDGGCSLFARLAAHASHGARPRGPRGR